MSDGAIMEKIAAIELEISRTQVNKATSSHIGSLRARLCKLQRELVELAGPKGGPKGEGFDVTKTGDCRVGLVGISVRRKVDAVDEVDGGVLGGGGVRVHDADVRAGSGEF